MVEKTSQPTPTRQRSSYQFVVLVAGIVIWSVLGIAGAAAFLLAYALGLILVNVGVAWLNLGAMGSQLTRPQRVLIFACVLAAPLALLLQMAFYSDLPKSLSQTREYTADRLYLERLPCIAPRFVNTDLPQRFFIHAPEAREVNLRLGPNEPELSSEPLGHGLFLLDFNPRDGSPSGQDGATINATLTVDGVPHPREMTLFHPQPQPRWFSAAPSRGLAATVSEETDELIVVARGGDFHRIAVADGPTDCAMFDNGRRIAVCHRYDPTLWIVDADDGRVIERLEQPHFQTRMAVAPDELTLAVGVGGSQPGIQFLSLPDGKPDTFVELPFSPDWLCFGRDERELIVTDCLGREVHRLTLQTSSEQADPAWRVDGDSIPLPRPVVTMCRSPDGEQILLAVTAPHFGSSSVEANHFIEDTIHHLDLANWAISHTWSTHRRGDMQDGPGDTEHGVSPMGMTVVDDVMLMTFAGSDEVSPIAPQTGAILNYRVFHEESLNAPHGVADLGEDYWCVSSPANGTIGILDPAGELETLIRLAASDEELAESSPVTLQRRRGYRAFYEQTRAGLSCQSCHLHGDNDYCLHNIGSTEMVGVLSVRGIGGTAPYLRDGSYWRLRDLHDVAVGVYRGFGREVPWDRGDAMAAFMRGLAPNVNPRALEVHDLKRLQAGMDAFVKADCVTCHAPPTMTNLAQHPNRLLFPEHGAVLDEVTGMQTFVDTPSLRSVALAPPFLHDGRAATLESVLRDHNRANRHGNTRALDEDQFRDLLYFLENL